MSAESEAVDFRFRFEQKEKELVGLCVQKEKELVDICDQQIKRLQKMVLDRDKDILDRDKHIAELTEKLFVLKEDFKYNLELLDGRDVELSHYEAELSTLQLSGKEAAKNLQEAHQKLVESEFQRVQEKARGEEKEKTYQRTLLGIREQMETLRLTREQLLTMHKESFETATGELMLEVKKAQIAQEMNSKMLETQNLDRLRIQELQSQLELDMLRNKLVSAEATIVQLEAQSQEQIVERDKTIESMSMELKQLQKDKEDTKTNADMTDKSTAKLLLLEDEHQQDVLQLKLQIQDLQKRLEIAETRLAQCREQPGVIAAYLDKVGQLEQQLMTRENEMHMKLEGVDAYVRETVQLQDKKVQELKAKTFDWETQHDLLLSKYSALQKELIEGSRRENITESFNFPRMERMGRKEDLRSFNHNHGSGRPLLTSAPLPSSHHGKDISSGGNSIGSSLPSPSPLMSPTFPNIEGGLRPRQLSELHEISNTQGDEDVKLATLLDENRGLRESVQTLKDQNECFRSVVGTMRGQMEALQKSMYDAKTSAVGLAKGDTGEVRLLRDEVNTLASEIHQLRQGRAHVVEDQARDWFPGPQSVRKITEQSGNFESATMDNAQSAVKIVELERVQAVLRKQLQRAAVDVLRMTNERDRLMEISNSLHADFNSLHRLVQERDLKRSAPPPGCYGHNQGHLKNRMGNKDNQVSNGERKHVASSSPSRPNTSPVKTSTRAQGVHGRGSKQAADRPTESRSKQPPRDEVIEERDRKWLHLEGKLESLHVRPEVLEDYVHKGTASQRSKLQQTIKRGESQAASKAKVRNYNIKDDALAALHYYHRHQATTQHQETL